MNKDTRTEQVKKNITASIVSILNDASLNDSQADVEEITNEFYDAIEIEANILTQNIGKPTPKLR